MSIKSGSTEAGTARSGRLRANAISALGAATIAMAFMGPATSVFFNTAPGAAKMGYGLPLGTLLALVVCFALASTIASFSRSMPTAGLAYTFNTRAFGSGAGFTSGWVLAFAYLMVGPMLVAAMGSFGTEFLDQHLHVHGVPWWVVSAAIVAVIFLIGRSGVQRSVQTALIFLVLEITVMLALFGTVLGQGGKEGLSLAPFFPGNSLDGISGLGYGMLWGILMFVGFESAGTLGEETRDPRRNVPLALFMAVGLIGVFYVLSTYAAAIGFGQSGTEAFAEDPGPWNTLADQYWGGKVAWVIALTVLNSQFANLLSGSNAAVRMLYAMGRERMLPHRLGKTNATGSPVAAWIAYLALTVLITFGLGAAMGPLGVYAFMGTILGLGIILVYIAMSLGLVRYAWRHERASFSPYRHAAVPIVSSLLLLLPIYGLLWPRPDWPYDLVPYIVVAWIITGVGVFQWMAAHRPERVEGMGRIWAEETSGAADTTVSSEPESASTLA
jgi:amino acid transporter